MQTSAKTKAKEFCKWQELPEHVQESVEKLLLEHERDTRHTAIEKINTLNTYEVEVYNQEFMGMSYTSGLVLSDAESCIQNLKVGE